MRAFAQKQNPLHKRVSSGFAHSNAAMSEPIHHTHPLLHLQRTIGNQAVQRLLQADAATDGRKSLAPEATPVLQQQAANAPNTIQRENGNGAEAAGTVGLNIDVTVYSGDTSDPLHETAKGIAESRYKTGKTNLAFPINRIEDLHQTLQLYAYLNKLQPEERIEKWKREGNFFLVPEDHPGFVNKITIIGHGRAGTKGKEPFYGFGGVAYKTSELAGLHQNGLDFSRYMISGGTVFLEGCEAAAGEEGRLFLFQIGQIFFGSRKKGRIKANTTVSMPIAGEIVGGSARELVWPDDFSDYISKAPSASDIRDTLKGGWRGAGLDVYLTPVGSDKLIGSYGTTGVITGFIKNQRVDYTWRDKEGEGKGYWVLSKDTLKLEGKWGFGDSDSNGGQWNLVKQ